MAFLARLCGKRPSKEPNPKAKRLIPYVFVPLVAKANAATQTNDSMAKAIAAVMRPIPEEQHNRSVIDVPNKTVVHVNMEELRDLESSMDLFSPHEQSFGPPQGDDVMAGSWVVNGSVGHIGRVLVVAGTDPYEPENHLVEVLYTTEHICEFKDRIMKMHLWDHYPETIGKFVLHDWWDKRGTWLIPNGEKFLVKVAKLPGNVPIVL